MKPASELTDAQRQFIAAAAPVISMAAKMIPNLTTSEFVECLERMHQHGVKLLENWDHDEPVSGEQTICE